MPNVYTNVSLTYIILCEIIILYFLLNDVLEQKLMGTLSSAGLFEPGSIQERKKYPPTSQFISALSLRSDFLRRYFFLNPQNLAMTHQDRPPFMRHAEFYTDC